MLELRLDRARTTKDVDLGMMGAPENLLAQLQEAGRTQLGDFMSFEVVRDAAQPEIQNDGMPYEGYRFRAECTIAGRLFGQRLGVDVAFGDPMVGAAEIVTGEDLLDFIGVAPPTVRLYPVETHLAEKLHAFTMPRQRPNTRVKDLPDLALLATTRRIEARVLREAIATTFAHRNTHAIPTAPGPARRVEAGLRGAGARRRVAVEDPRRRRGGRPGLLESGARLRCRCGVAADVVDVARANVICRPLSSGSDPGGTRTRNLPGHYAGCSAVESYGACTAIS